MMQTITNLTPENAQKLADALKTMGKIESVKLPTTAEIKANKNDINPLLKKLDVSNLKSR